MTAAARAATSAALLPPLLLLLVSLDVGIDGRHAAAGRAAEEPRELLHSCSSGIQSKRYMRPSCGAGKQFYKEVVM